MRNILIVDALSTGYNYVSDVVNMGYKPVVMETNQLKGTHSDPQAVYKTIPYSFEVLEEMPTYEETVELVKKYNPKVIIPGTESGVELATLLAESLGLPGNPTSILASMKSKAEMQLALKRYGIRYIKGEIVSSVEEAEAFLKENKLHMGVVKPLSGAGSNGVAVCDTVEQVLVAVRERLTQKDYFGREINQVLVQERIVGTEYIVNTMSCNGKHRVSSMFVYDKVKTDEGGYIYRNCESIKHLRPADSELLNYALETVKAIGIKYGPVHGEYMVDDKGPVLIEVNCRPMGFSTPAEFLNLIFGQHETDAALECYLMPEKFDADAKKPYAPIRKGYQKCTIIPRKIEAESIPLWVIAENLRSSYKIALPDRNKVVQFDKTEDLTSSGGVIFLVHDSDEVVKSDSELLCELESKYFDLAFSEGVSRPWFVVNDGVSRNSTDIIKDLGLLGTILSVSETDEELENVLNITPDKLDGVHYSFDNVIININKSLISLKETEALKLIFDIMKKTRQGGRVVIPDSTYRYLSYGHKGAEMLMRILGIEIEVTVENISKYVVGRRI